MTRGLAILGVILAGSVLAPACGGSSPNDRCSGEGEVFASPPGCGEGGSALAVAGCYVACTTAGAACAGGKTCKAMQVNPCVCDPTSGEGCCDACSGEALLCMP